MVTVISAQCTGRIHAALCYSREDAQTDHDNLMRMSLTVDAPGLHPELSPAYASQELRIEQFELVDVNAVASFESLHTVYVHDHLQASPIPPISGPVMQARRQQVLTTASSGNGVYLEDA